MSKLDRILVVFFKALGLSFFLLCACCTNPAKQTEVDENGIREIEIKRNLSNTKGLNLSKVASSIEYCALETDNHCLVRYPGMEFYCSKDYLVAIGSQTLQYHPVCYVFDRKTGEFIRQISRYGQGPNEYTEIKESFWDKENEQICVSGNMKNYFYNLDGSLSYTINASTTPIVSIGGNFIVYKDGFVRYFPGHPTNSRPRIAFYNKNGLLLDTIPEYRLVKRDNYNKPYSPIPYGGQLYVFQDNLYYKDIFCDTLYQIQDFSLQPRYIFNTGGLEVPYEIQCEGQYDEGSLFSEGDAIDLWEKYIYINRINESNKHLFFIIEYRNQLYTAIYEKSQNNLQIMKPVTLPNLKQRRFSHLQYGLENDLDGGLPFWPQKMISDNKMMCVFTAAELLELDTSKVTDDKLKNLLKNLKEDDNPIVAFVTLKD